jgi:hypothetical protein
MDESGSSETQPGESSLQLCHPPSGRVTQLFHLRLAGPMVEVFYPASTRGTVSYSGGIYHSDAWSYRIQKEKRKQVL